MDPVLIVAIAVLNFFAAFFGVIVGGTNLVMTPLLISLGVPAPSAVATTRVGLLGAVPVGLLKFHRGGKVIWGIGLPLIVVSFVGTCIGSSIVLTISEMLLQRMIGVFILCILFIIILNRRFGLEERRKSAGPASRSMGFILLLFAAILGTVMGGGTPIIVSYILIFFFGMTFLESSGTRKIGAVAGVITGSVIFIAVGIVLFEIAIPLIISGILGSWAGSHYALKKGEEWARLLFIVVIAILSLKMLVF
jgi:uncharacterized membrane protein YfcA